MATGAVASTLMLPEPSASSAGLPMDRLLDVEDLLESAVGARSACIFVADYAQQFLSPVRDTESAASVEVDTTVHGRVFHTGQAHLTAGHVIAPLVEGRDRIGVVECVFDRDVPGSVDLVDAICAALLLVLVSKRRYTDLVLRARRARPLSTAAEMQWDLLPPLSGHASGAASPASSNQRIPRVAIPSTTPSMAICWSSS